MKILFCPTLETVNAKMTSAIDQGPAAAVGTMAAKYEYDITGHATSA